MVCSILPTHSALSDCEVSLAYTKCAANQLMCFRVACGSRSFAIWPSRRLCFETEGPILKPATRGSGRANVLQSMFMPLLKVPKLMPGGTEPQHHRAAAILLTAVSATVGHWSFWRQGERRETAELSRGKAGVAPKGGVGLVAAEPLSWAWAPDTGLLQFLPAKWLVVTWVAPLQAWSFPWGDTYSCCNSCRMQQ